MVYVISVSNWNSVYMGSKYGNITKLTYKPTCFDWPLTNLNKNICFFFNL